MCANVSTIQAAPFVLNSAESVCCIIWSEKMVINLSDNCFD